MPDESQDPSANTQAFRKFAKQTAPAETGRNNLIMILAIAAAALFAVIAAVVLLLF